MTPRQSLGWFVGLTILLLLVTGWIAWKPPTPPNVGFESAAAVLGIVTAAAIGIERVIEAGWTIIGLTKGSWWPLKTVGQQVDKLVSSLDDTLNPFYEEAQTRVDTIAKAQDWTQDQIDAAKKELTDIQSRISELTTLAPDNQRVQLIAESASQGVRYVEKKYPDLKNAAAVANQAVTGVAAFIATFKDNPGRRLISIYAGAILGLIVAGTIGLDVIQAAMQEPPGSEAIAVQPGSQEPSESMGIFEHLPGLGIALTGVLMGLGANPTHEVIRTLQEIKKSRKTANKEVPNT